MARHITIDGKQHELRATVWAVRELLKKYKNTMDLRADTWTEDMILEYSTELAWTLCKDKPCRTYEQFAKTYSAQDMRDNMTILYAELYGFDTPQIKTEDDRTEGDRELGNS